MTVQREPAVTSPAVDSRSPFVRLTDLIAGMTPGKGGLHALDNRVPVFNTIGEAVHQTGANTSCIFVPAAGAHARRSGGDSGRPP